MPSLAEEVMAAPVISFIIWFALKVMGLIAQNPTVQTFTPQQKATLGWFLWVNQASLLSVDIADWFLVLAGTGVVLVAGLQVYRSSSRRDVFDV